MNKNTPEVTSFDVFRQQQEATWDVNNALKSLG